MELALQCDKLIAKRTGVKEVTILVFMELALQCNELIAKRTELKGHNPCFYGISFAIQKGLQKPFG